MWNSHKLNIAPSVQPGLEHMEHVLIRLEPCCVKLCLPWQLASGVLLLMAVLLVPVGS